MCPPHPHGVCARMPVTSMVVVVEKNLYEIGIIDPGRIELFLEGKSSDRSLNFGNHVKVKGVN